MKLFPIAFRGCYLIPEAMGFYETTEGILGISFRPRRKFDYSVEAEKLSLELDSRGGLTHIEVRQPKENWLVLPRIIPPFHLYRSSALFPVPCREEEEEYLTNLQQNILCVEFSPRPAWRAVEIADTVVAEITSDYRLLRLWILKLVEDFGNRKELAWLKAGSVYSPYLI